MKRISIIVSLLFVLLPIHPSQAQQDDLTSAFIAITFEEVSAGNPCLLAVDAYAGLYGGDVGSENLPVVTDSSDCSFAAGTSLRIRTGRIANSYLIFNSGSFSIDLFLQGQSVLSENTDGAESMNTQADFDEILFTTAEGGTISDISLSFEFERLASDAFTFDGAAEGTPCAEGLAWAYLTEATGDAVIAATSDTGLGAPECSIPPNTELVFKLNTPASLIEFASSGGAVINLFMDGHPVQPSASIMGSGGYFATSIVGFNEVRILALDTGVRIDNLSLEYPAFDFPQYVVMPETAPDCAAFLDGAENINAAGLSTTDFGTPTIENSGCMFNPGNELTLSFERPVVTFGFWSTGGAVVEAYRNGALVRPADIVRWVEGYYFISHADGIDTIIIKEESGFSSIRVADIRYSVLPATGLDVINFFDRAEGTPCTDILAEAGITATAEFPPEWEAPSIQPSDAETAFGFDQRCDFKPGSSLTINLDRQAIGINFFMVGGATVQFFRDGQPVTEAIDVSGLPFTYSEQIWTGFDQIVFTEPSGFSSFGLIGIEILYGE